MRPEEISSITFIQGYYNFPITVVDVGANTGTYTERLMESVPLKKVYLFEPIKSCFDKIKKIPASKAFNLAVGSRKGIATFYEAIGRESHSSIVNRSWLYAKPEYNIIKREVEVERIDNLITEHIHLIKIDVEGYELEALKGCSRLLEHKKIDFIQFEYGGTFKDNNLKLNDVINFLSQTGYKVYNLENNKFNSIETYVDDYRHVNFFATHLFTCPTPIPMLK